MADSPVIGYWKCERCSIHTPKDEWGPGRITCPKCNQIAPTAKEWHAINNEIWNGTEWVKDLMNHE